VLAKQRAVLALHAAAGLHDGVVGLVHASAIEAGAYAARAAAPALVVVLVLLGQVLELRTRNLTTNGIANLLKLEPPKARRVTSGEDQEIPIDLVLAGDRLRVLPGANVPVDGCVIEGSSDIDESMVTGESSPLAKTLGDQVIGGTINGAGSFVMRAERVGHDTMLSQIVELVLQAQRSEAPFQGLADRVSAYFAPVVLAVSILTFYVWMLMGPEPRIAFALFNAVAVLVIACPGAIGLATPLSIKFAIGRGAQEGILVKNAKSLDTLEKITAVVLDMTGTLTKGKPEIVDVLPASGLEVNEFLRLAASLELSSDHPLASAIVKCAKNRGIVLETATEFRTVTAGGVSGKVGGRTVMVGKPEFLRNGKIEGLDPFVAWAVGLQENGKIVLYVAIDDQPAGILGLVDPIKPTAANAVADLQAMGLKLAMVTGENIRTATVVARQLGIGFIEAGMEPADKVAFVKKWRKDGQHVAMVGDGLNDAPALSEADVGMAMGTGSELAMSGCCITLVKGDLRGIPKALSLGRTTMWNIRQNLFFALLYNALGIPLAAGVLYPAFGILLSPIIAGAAMTLGSLSVMGNALRLKSAKL
ncbi:MAG: copper-translocating P-type ATPase, partial [Fibrobacterota bacterium]